MDRFAIERELRNRYAFLNGPAVVAINVYREAKSQSDACRDTTRNNALSLSQRSAAAFPGLRAMTRMMTSQKALQDVWQEQERIFNQLLTMGAIPIVRWNRG